MIAKDYFGDENAMIRFDMSEFMEKFSVSKLIGSPAGYVGFEEGGGLTEAVRRKPYSVVLFDEIEKASPDVLNILLQILDEGQLKDSKGRLIDFKSTIIVMTSNIGSEEFSRKQVSIGFSTGSSKEMDDKGFEQIKERIMDQLKSHLSPELINRIDYKVIFRPLNKENLTEIFNKQLTSFLDIWKTNEQVTLPKFNKKQIEEIIDKIYDPQYGARPVERYIQNDIEGDLIAMVLNG
ncbi:MAG: AAA family ATPase [Candidatus Peribacteria bacterium]|nr:AAA family ATPase [Candidatus Peribacteria bacterium]